MEKHLAAEKVAQELLAEEEEKKTSSKVTSSRSFRSLTILEGWEGEGKDEEEEEAQVEGHVSIINLKCKSRNFKDS